MRTVMLIIGAACAGLGILTGVISGFGLPDGADVATRLSTVGFDALDNITILPDGYLAIGLVVVGVGMLVAANRTAYQETGGY